MSGECNLCGWIGHTERYCPTLQNQGPPNVDVPIDQQTRECLIAQVEAMDKQAKDNEPRRAALEQFLKSVGELGGERRLAFVRLQKSRIFWTLRMHLPCKASVYRFSLDPRRPHPYPEGKGMSYKQREPHPGYKNSSTKQCNEHAEPVSKWTLSANVRNVWYRILKCTVCRFEMLECKDSEPEGDK